MYDNDKAIQLLHSFTIWNNNTQCFLQQQDRSEETSVKLISKYKTNKENEPENILKYLPFCSGLSVLTEPLESDDLPMVNIGLDYGSTKPLPDPILTYYW